MQESVKLAKIAPPNGMGFSYPIKTLIDLIIFDVILACEGLFFEMHKLILSVTPPFT